MDKDIDGMTMEEVVDEEAALEIGCGGGTGIDIGTARQGRATAWAKNVDEAEAAGADPTAAVGARLAICIFRS